MRLRLSIGALLATTAIARAQVPVSLPTTPAVVVAAPVMTDSIPVWERPQGALLRPGTLTYTLSLHRPDGQIASLGTRTVAVSDVVVGGTQAWLIAESRTGTAVITTDSVLLRQSDLSPERWVATIGSGQLGASFTADSIFGAVQTYQGRASFAVAIPKGVFLSAGMMEKLIELFPLRVGFRAAAALMLVEGNAPRMEPAVIEVAREDRLEWGGLGVECWVVVVRAGAIEQRLWVSKDSAHVVRSEQTLSTGMYSAELQP